MAVIPHPVTTPLSYKVATLSAIIAGSADTDTLTPQVGEITFNPTTQSGSWTGISGNVASAATELAAVMTQSEANAQQQRSDHRGYAVRYE